MTKLKSELSEKNKYWIPKHRYYELRHFCLQYNDWRTAYNTISYISAVDLSPLLARSDLNDPVARAAEARIQGCEVPAQEACQQEQRNRPRGR